MFLAKVLIYFFYYDSIYLENTYTATAFTYDESGNPFSVDCYYGADDVTPTTYYYVLNLQGDVIQLRDENDVVAVNYTTTHGVKCCQ